MAGVHPGPSLPERHDSLADRVLPSVPGVRLDRARGAHGLRRLAGTRALPAHRLAGDRRRAAGTRAGGPRRDRGEDGSESLVGDGALRRGTRVRSRRRVRGRRLDLRRPSRTRDRRPWRPELRPPRADHDRRHVRVVVRGHRGPGDGRRPGLHRLAVDERPVRAGARGGRHVDVPASRAGRARVRPGGVAGRAGPHDEHAPARPRAVLDAPAGAVRGPDRGRRGAGVDATAALARRRSRRALGPHLGDARAPDHDRLPHRRDHPTGGIIARCGGGALRRRLAHVAGHGHRLLPPDQARDHLPAAGHDRAGHVPGRGTRPVALAHPGHPRGRRDGRRLGQRDQPVPGPRHRHDHEAHAPASAAVQHRHARAGPALRVRPGRRSRSSTSPSR